MQRCFKYHKDSILGFIIHGGLLSVRLTHRMTYLCRSVNMLSTDRLVYEDTRGERCGGRQNKSGPKCRNSRHRLKPVLPFAGMFLAGQLRCVAYMALLVSPA